MKNKWLIYKKMIGASTGGTGQEDNWRHTWNSANPIERKKNHKKKYHAKMLFIVFLWRNNY